MGAGPARRLTPFGVVLGAALAACAPEPPDAWPFGPPEPSPAGLIGTHHRVASLEWVSEDGRALVIRQARDDGDTGGDGEIQPGPRGPGRVSRDEPRSYLVLGSGRGHAIDELVAATPGGRHLLVTHAGRLLLLDTLERRALDLSARGAPAPGEDEPRPGHHRPRFDPTASWLLYLRRAPAHTVAPAERTVAVVRELATGDEVVIDPGEGLLWTAEFAGERWVDLAVIPSDTDGNGALEPCPVPAGLAPPPPGCGDRVVHRLAPVRGGPVREVRDFAGALGEVLLERRADGSVGPHGGRATDVRVPASCRGAIRQLDAAAQLVVATCCDDPVRERGCRLGLFGPSTREVLPDHWEVTQAQGRRVVLHGSPQAVLDLDTETIARLEEGEIAIALHGSRVLTRMGDRVWLVDLSTGRRRRIGPAPASESRARRAGSVVMINGRVLDLETGVVFGSYDEAPLAVDARGRLLFPYRWSPGPHRKAFGPLLWSDGGRPEFPATEFDPFAEGGLADAIVCSAGPAPAADRPVADARAAEPLRGPLRTRRGVDYLERRARGETDGARLRCLMRLLFETDQSDARVALFGLIDHEDPEIGTLALDYVEAMTLARELDAGADVDLP